MNVGLRIGLFVLGLVALANLTAQASPPFSGTIFIDPDIITSSDPTAFQGMSYSGQDFRWMFDRRVDDWTYVNAFLFNATFEDGLTCEIQVNPEFGSSSAALAQAQRYGTVIGQLPTALRMNVQTVWIHQGTELFGGGNNSLLIHTGQADLYALDGILEEALVHEASHTSLDPAHAAAPQWLAAQAADGEFISTYARDFPDREDIAESFLPYLAIRHRPDRISQGLADTILQTIPNRIAYFDAQSFNMYPIAGTSLQPVVTTSAASTITSSGAILTGTVNPQGSSGFAYFEWGTDSALTTPSSTGGVAVSATKTSQPFAAPRSGLASNTTFYFRMVFSNTANGTYQKGVIASFKTLQPVVTTSAASTITSSSAILTGTVNPQGSSGFAYFEWGTDSALTTRSSTGGVAVSATKTAQPFAAPRSGLASNTTFYFRMVFSNTANGTYQKGVIASFKTLQPVVTTSAASTITSSSAILTGTVNPQGSSGFAYFEWGTDSALTTPSSTGGVAVSATKTAQPFAAPRSGLASNTTFYFRMVFSNTANGTHQKGVIASFKTLRPVVTTSAASTVTSSGAILTGTVNPQGSSGFAYFEWGTDSALTTRSSTGGVAVSATKTAQPFAAPRSGLASNTTFYFRMVFSNTANGTYQKGVIASFKTLQPVVTTSAASTITSSSAILTGTVNPQGSSGFAYFEWGTDSALTTRSSTGGVAVSATKTAQPFAAPRSGLASNTTFYFRMVFSNTANGTYQKGVIASFKTLQPVVTTSAASTITSSSAILTGTVNPQGSSGFAYFEWGTDSALTTPSSTGGVAVSATKTAQPFAAPRSGLASNTTFYFRMVFSNTANGTYQKGSILSFTTP